MFSTHIPISVLFRSDYTLQPTRVAYKTILCYSIYTILTYFSGCFFRLHSNVSHRIEFVWLSRVKLLWWLITLTFMIKLQCIYDKISPHCHFRFYIRYFYHQFETTILICKQQTRNFHWIFRYWFSKYFKIWKK